MKTRLAVLVALSLAACEKKEAEVEPTPSPVAATPSPVAISTPAAATPSDLAPAGVFFLVEKVSIETSDSIVGFKPGQQLKKVRDGVYAANGLELRLRDDQVTNSLSRARALLARDAAAQAALARPASARPAPGAAASSQNSAPLPSSTPATPAPVATSMGAEAVHDKVKMYYDRQLHKWVTVHVQ